MVIVTSILFVVCLSATIGGGVFDLYYTHKARENIKTKEEQDEFDRRIFATSIPGTLGNPFPFTKVWKKREKVP